MRVCFFFLLTVLALLTTSTTRAATWTVEIFDYYFMPTNITIAPGDTVTWINRVFRRHDTTHNNLLWASPALSRNQSFSYTFTETGTYPYLCLLHATTNPEQTGTVSVAQANLPPTVNITSPANGANFSAPASFVINAAASDPDGTVASVQFFVNGNSAGVSSGPTFTANVNGLASGNYTLTAVATDNQGATQASAPINVAVSAPVKFPLAIAVQPPGSGSITLDPPPPGEGYDSGTLVTLTAAAVQDFAFAGWSGDLSGLNNPAMLVMDGPKSVTASFSPTTAPSFTLTLLTHPIVGGTISVSQAPNGPNGSYLDGTTVTLTATPSFGFSFINWSGAVVSSISSNNITMRSNTVVTANFVESNERRYTLTALAQPPELGSINISPAPEGDGQFPEGALVQLEAMPLAGIDFLGWTGDVSNSAFTISVVLTTNRSLIARFARPPAAYTLLLSNNPPQAGEILVSPPPRGDGTYAGSTTIALAALAEPGFRFVCWTGPVPIGSTNNPLIFVTDATPTVATQTLSITALYEPLPALDFAPLTGSYAGLLLDETETNFATCGFLSVRVGKTGAFRGTAAIGGVRERFAGQFDSQGYAPFALRGGTLLGSLQLEEEVESITGEITDGIRSPKLALHRRVALTNAEEFLGNHEIVIPAAGPVVSKGAGTLTISAKGAAHVRGRLGDGKSFRDQTFIARDGRVPLFVPLYGNRGALAGWLELHGSLLLGEVRWFRPADSRHATYPDGFSLLLPLGGSCSQCACCILAAHDDANHRNAQRSQGGRNPGDSWCGVSIPNAARLSASAACGGGCGDVCGQCGEKSR